MGKDNGGRAARQPQAPRQIPVPGKVSPLMSTSRHTQYRWWAAPCLGGVVDLVLTASGRKIRASGAVAHGELYCAHCKWAYSVCHPCQKPGVKIGDTSPSAPGYVTPIAMKGVSGGCRGAICRLWVADGGRKVALRALAVPFCPPLLEPMLSGNGFEGWVGVRL